MSNEVPYDKLPKKKKREINARYRGSWNGVNPITRKPKNSKAYDRNKEKSNRRTDED